MVRLPLLSSIVPSPFQRIYSIKVPSGVEEQLAREGKRASDYELLAYNSFLWCLLTLGPLAILMVWTFPYPYVLISAGAVTSTFAIPAWVLSIPSRTYRVEQRSYLLDSPAVIGAMTMSMNRSSSLERALEFGSRSGQGALQTSLCSLAWKALTGEVQDLRRGISAWTANLDLRNEGLRRSLHLIMAAEEEGGKEGRDRLLDRANSLVLEGLREASERYVGSLSFPVMLVFAFGVLAPVMLFSLIPLMGMGGGLTNEGLNITSLALVLLVLVPAVTLIYIRTMIRRNPVGRRPDGRPSFGGPQLTLMCLSVPASLLVFAVTGTAATSALAGLVLLLAALHLSGDEGNRDKGESIGSFIDGLYRLGNAMLGGQDLEAAFEDVVLMEEGEFKKWGLKMVHATRTGRLSLVDAVRGDGELKGLDLALHQNFLTVMECAKEDHRGAGRVAVNLAQCQSDLARTQRRIRESLRSVVDMMNSTSLVFAPAIIGITSGIMGLMGGEQDWLVAVASVYVVELALLINYFTSNLDGRRAARKGLRSYGMRGTVALAVFLTASLCGQTLLFHLL